MNPREYGVMYAAEEHHWWYRGLHDLVVRSVAAEHRHKGPLSILDAGCGTGRLCQLLAPYGTVSGCDVSDLALEFCRKRGLDHVFQADLNDAELGEERYDVITSLDVLYHTAVTDEARVLDSFRRALRPGGLLVLNLVAFEFLRSTHDIAVHTRRRYTRPALAEMLRRSGFTVESATYRHCLLFPPVAAYRLVRRALHRAAPEETASDVSLPAPLVNGLLWRLCLLENRIVQHCPLPFGTSVFAVARSADIPPHHRR